MHFLTLHEVIHNIATVTGLLRLSGAGGINAEHCLIRPLDETPHDSPDDKSINGVCSCDVSHNEHIRKDVALEFQVINTRC